MAKYTPLEKFLENLDKKQNDVTLDFTQIERIIADRLPQSAFKHSAWWANEMDGSHIEAHAWMGAGCKVDNVDFARKCVRFIRSS
jgi:hypothetical protein